MDEPCIHVRNLTKSFAGRTVVDNLSLDVQKGEVFALLGHNGAGKSTTIDLILGLKTPDRGDAKILGMDAAKNRKQVFVQVGVQLLRTLPEIQAACIFHRGSYGTLPESYEAVLRFIEENGYEIAGAIRESYIDGVWNQDDDSGWLTEIQIPVRKQTA